MIRFWMSLSVILTACATARVGQGQVPPAIRPASPTARPAPIAGEAGIVIVAPSSGPNSETGTPGAPPPQNAEQAQQKQAQQKQQRLQKIAKLQFDRRPSTMLATWARTQAHGGLPPGVPPQPGPIPFTTQVRGLQRDVTLGRWDRVRSYLEDLDNDEATAIYRRILDALQGTAKSAPPGLPPEVQAQLQKLQQLQQRQGQRGVAETHQLDFDDILSLADSAPGDLDRDAIRRLGGLVRNAIQAGNAIDALVTRLETEMVNRDSPILDRRQAAQLLFAARQPIAAGRFLPTIEQATAADDLEALNLLSAHAIAKHAEDRDKAILERAWQITQAVLASAKIADEAKAEALKRAVELAPQIESELGRTWLEASFNGAPERGMRIIAAIGTGSSRGFQTQARNSATRLRSLKLQSTAVETLLTSAPDRAAEWSETLNLLATNWLREANRSYQYDNSRRRGPSLQRDQFGNYFYVDQTGMNPRRVNNNNVAAIKTADLLEIRPSDAWLEHVVESLRPQFETVIAQLYLKVGEEDAALPHIENLAATYPAEAVDLVAEFLRVWTTNHDPNASRNRTNHYMYMYGYERRAESIPLTRSKQERNLKELASLVRRLNALPLDRIDEQLLVSAFTTCHSSAEVYRIEAIEAVFGSLEDLEAKTLAALAQRMRANLAGIWRQPATQKEKQTRRKQRDIMIEVVRGYRVAGDVIAGGLERHPDDWRLQLARAALEHDENNYRREVAPDSEFTDRREGAFEGFRRAAEQYASLVPSLNEEDETTEAFELWYYASLGACDLGRIQESHVPDLAQPARIREAILSLPGSAAERHLAMFANTLFTRMSAVKPANKYRYVRLGLDIVGDHERAAEARRVFDYYQDLVTEIKLQTVIDGSDVVGHERPFGVFVNLVHTRDIERESGGFGRYLQNQNSSSSYRYNYGRPLENYRDKFEEIAAEILGEHFEILSVTFQKPDVNSRALPEYGWRVTPYAYLLLKARGPEIDKLPPMRLDLDFLDTSGYAVLPVESPAVPLDATSNPTGPRPVENLVVTQTLDERQATEGKLLLEIQASANGLVPEFDELVQFAPADFEVTELQDEGVSVSRFDPEQEAIAIVSERTWLVTLEGREDLRERAATFAFATPKLDVNEVTFQRYDDADLISVDAEIELERQYGSTSRTWMWWLVPIAIVAVLGVAFVFRKARDEIDPVPVGIGLPRAITPFTVLGLLRHIEHHNGLDAAGKADLSRSIEQLERHYFAVEGEAEMDLQHLAESWIRRARLRI